MIASISAQPRLPAPAVAVSIPARRRLPAAIVREALASIAMLAATLAACASSPPPPCPYVPGPEPCQVCRTPASLRRAGETVPVASVRQPPDPEKVPFWSGAELAPEPPDPSLYVHCRPCACRGDGKLAPWDDWVEINRRAYARLRRARAPYPVAIVPGFHAGGFIARYRMKVALRLLRHGWVAAIVVSGGYRRGGHNEARYLLAQARELASAYEVDVTDRILIEPCACHTLTNLRDSLRLMAAMGLRQGLLVSDAKMTAQAGVFAADLDGLVRRDLDCPVGRMSFMLGSTPLNRLGDSGNGCRAPLSIRRNPLTFFLPGARLAVFWVSPFTTVGGKELSALDCGPGSKELRDCEADDADPLAGSCLPMLGATDLRCEPWGDVPPPDAPETSPPG